MSKFPPFPPLARRAQSAALALSLGLLAVPAAARAQASAAPTIAAAAPDTVFARAQRLVNQGNGAAGRAIVDSVLTAAPAGSPQAAEALFWRASLAASSDDAERDYRRLAVEFPLSSRAEDALLRLAQMELARGNREQALRHLERLALEHPTGASRPRASYWTARILFEMNDATGACAAIAGARTSVPPDDVELRNQIEYTARRCQRLETERMADATSATAAPESTATASARPTAPVASAPTTTAPSTAAPSRPAPTRTAPATSAPARDTRTFSVQVAAFDTRRAADALATRLRNGGHDARVDGTSAPFRVRIGRYRTREEAVALQRRLKARGTNGFIVAEGGAQ